MTQLAIITMTVICGTVWGGFACLLCLALFRERSKRPSGEVDGPQ